MADVAGRGDRSWLSRAGRRTLDEVRRLLAAVPVAIDAYFRDRLPQHAAGIAYRVLFSLAPLAIVLVSVFGLVLRDDQLRADVTETIVGWLPVSDDGEETVADAIDVLASPTSAVGLLSLAVFAWASTGMMAAVRIGLETALQVDRRRPAVRGKLVDFLLVAGAGALVLVMIATAFAAQVVTRFVGGVAGELGFDGGVLAELVRLAIPLALSTVVVMLLYRFVPSRRLGRGDAFAGGLVTGVLVVAISAASALVYDRIAGLSVIYGSITVVLVFLYSVYLYASALLFGAELASARSRGLAARGAAVPLPEQLRRAVRGLFVHRESQRRDPPGP